MCWRRFLRGRRSCTLRRRLDDRRIDVLSCAQVDEMKKRNVHEDCALFVLSVIFSVVCWVSHFVATKVTAVQIKQSECPLD